MRTRSAHRRAMAPGVVGLGVPVVERLPVRERRALAREFPGIPIVTVRIRPRGALDADPVTVEDSTRVLVEQGFNLAYNAALASVGRPSMAAGGMNPLDRVTIWMEPDGFGRDVPRITLATDVDVFHVEGEIRGHLEDISEYEAQQLVSDFYPEDGGIIRRGALRDEMVGLGFDLDRFQRAGVGRRNEGHREAGVFVPHRGPARRRQARLLRNFMEREGHLLRDPGARRLGWFQLRTYLNVGNMFFYYRFFLAAAVPVVAGRRGRRVGGWKNGLLGLTRNQIFRFGGIIPQEVTQENDLCIYLAVRYATKFTYDNVNKTVERQVEEMPVALSRWVGPVEEAVGLREDFGLSVEFGLETHVEALSLYYKCVIHVFDYDSGGVEVFCSTEDVREGGCEAHKVILVIDHHAYPVLKPHFLVQDSAKYLFCPVCFHCFKSKRDLFYHIARCTREKAMDTIDYNIRRKFEKRSFVGLYYVVKGVYFKTCTGCGNLRFAVEENSCDVGGVQSWICTCSVPHFECGSRSIQVLRCMKCQTGFPPWLKEEHKCRMRLTDPQPVDLTKIWVYDIESELNVMPRDPLKDFLDLAEDGDGDEDEDEEEQEKWSMEGVLTEFKMLKQMHEPNLVVMTPLVGDEVIQCGNIAEFLDVLYSDKRFEGCFFYAHNAGRYDIHFIVNELIQRGCIPDFIPGSSSGYTNMLRVTFGKRNFCDSYRLFPQALASLAKSFKLPILKGRFPYRFNRTQNRGYCGPLPPLAWYDPWSVRGEGAMEALIQWHDKEALKFQDGTWDLKEQLYLYCLDDVLILKQIMLRGIELFQNIFLRSDRVFENWTPPVIHITSHLTLTSAVVGACLNGMKDKVRLTLRDVDEMYMEAERFYELVLAYEHFFKGHQIAVVDDLKGIYEGKYSGYELDGKTVRVYADCFKCGCLKCYPMRQMTIPPNIYSFGELEKSFDYDRTSFATNIGVDEENLEVLWTHDYTELFSQETNQERLRAVLDMYQPISSRDAMFGGHTEAGALFAQSYGVHKICKIDVNSMYPFVCAELELPFGDPITLRMEEIDRDMFDRQEYFGLVRARFIPPKDLLFPILPRKIGNPGKLVFDCEERIGTYTTVDVYHAVELGYEVREIFEIRHFPPSQRKVGLFKEYVTVLFDVKAQAKIDEDPALYLLCKFALNSLWGKFGEKVHTSYTGFISSLRGYMDFMHAETIKNGTREVMEVSENIYLAKANYETVVCDSPRYYHPELACFVLAHARKILHSAIYALGPGRFLYCDTDSIIYMHTRGQSNVSIGAALGEWDIEVDGWPERYIDRFYSCGPKAYCEVYSDGTFKVKYKGVMGSAINQKLLKPSDFHILVEDYLRCLGGIKGEGMTLSTQDFSIRVKYSGGYEGVGVLSDYKVKRIRVVNEKRFVPDVFLDEDEINNYAIVRTLPYGFEGDLIETAYVTRENFSLNFSY